MKASFHSVALHRDPVAVAIAKVQRAGYSAFELNAELLPWAMPHVTPTTKAADRVAIVAAARDLGVTISAVGAHIPMVEEDPRSRPAAIDFVQGCIVLAADVGAPIVHILSGPLNAAVDRRHGWRWFADAVSQTTSFANERDVVLGIEAIAGHLFHSIDDYQLLRRDLPGVPFKINFDPSHLIVQGENPHRLVVEFGGDIVHVHMKDGAGRFPDFRFPPLGMGEINFPLLIDELRRQKYDGALSVEYEANVFGYDEPEGSILAHGRRFLEDLGVKATSL